MLGKAAHPHYNRPLPEWWMALMYCPFCNFPETKVTDSRLVGEGAQVRRRRECCQCAERFTTFESAELVMPKIVKRDGRRKPFDEEKLRRGLQRALEKRPVSVENMEQMIDHLKQKLRAYGEREVNSRQLGEWVMEELRQIDQVAYVRFASVYRAFEDIHEFGEEIRKLQTTIASTAIDKINPGLTQNENFVRNRGAK